jgi:hypothetical protein
MAISDRNIDKNAKFARSLVQLELGVSATGQAAKQTDSHVPGFAFEIVKVELYALTVTAAITADVHIQAATALAAAVAPVANTPTNAPLAASLAARRGSNTDAIQLKYTSDGTGAATNMRARVWIRPVPLQGEVYSV